MPVQLSKYLKFSNGKKRPDNNHGDFPVYGGNGPLGYTDMFNCHNCCVIGRVGAYCGNVYYSKNECWISDNAISAKTINSHDNILYFYYLLKNLKLWTRRIGTSQPLMTQSILNSIEVKQIPESETQNRIADILSSFDKKIELNTRIINNATIIIDTFFNEIYKRSNFVKLDNVVCRVNEKASERKYPVFSAVKSGDLVLSEDHFKKQVYSKKIDNYIVVNQGDFAYNPARVNIGSLGMNKFDFDGCVSPAYIVFSCDNSYQNYLDLLTKTNYFKESVAVRSSGSVRQALNYEDFKQIEVPWPTEVSIQKFNANINPYLSLINHLGQENIKLAEMRDTLLPKFMSGEIEV